MLKRLIRDNHFVNPVIRNSLRLLFGQSKNFLTNLTNYYRVYGVVKIRIQNVQLKVFTLADDHIANEIFYNRGYESVEFKLVSEIIKSSSFFVDVGANTGIFSIFAAKNSQRLKVIGFEPHPNNFLRFKKNIRLNQLTNIKAFQLALGQYEKTVQFTMPNDDSLSTTASVNEAFATYFQSIPHKKVAVPQRSLDSVLSEYEISSVDLIKIDVEYYELDVLRGAIRILTESKPLVLIEILDYQSVLRASPMLNGKINKNHALEIENFLKDLNYFPYAISNEGIYSIETVLEKQNERNFLFIPKLLPYSGYRFEELHRIFHVLSQTGST